jgi:hypothetical protein
MRVLGWPVTRPQAIVEHAAADLVALERLLRSAPEQLDRLLTLAEEIVDIGQRVLVIAERLDDRAEAIFELGVQLERRAGAMLDLGAHMESLGGQIDRRGAEIVERAAQVVETGGELITMLPVLERALELATPLEGAIDRFGRMVDRLPGAPAALRRQARSGGEAAESAAPAVAPAAGRRAGRSRKE